jgi:L-2-hydroxycarboxylate dehydrogenase (NAD+)
MALYYYEQLKSFSEKVFIKMGCPPEDAILAADALVAADLRGIDSHGVARLSGYIRLWEAGRINPKPTIQVIHQTPSTASIDGDAGLGLVVAPKSMKIALEKAANVGSGWVSVQNSNHFGIAGYHAMMALATDMIGFAMTNASPLVAPTFSSERLLGTNPIAVAIPADQQPAFVADFATTTAANGKLEILQRKEETAPLGWIQDSKGNPSVNPNELKQGGALLPLGGDREHGSHKGYCLGAIVDILSAVLSGANYAAWAPPFVHFLPLAANPVGKGLGHFLGAMRIDGFRPAEEFKQNMDTWILRFRNATPVAEQTKVYIPGDIERETAAERQTKGWDLLKPVEEDLKTIATKFKIDL